MTSMSKTFNDFNIFIKLLAYYVEIYRELHIKLPVTYNLYKFGKFSDTFNCHWDARELTVLQVSAWFQNELPSSKLNNTPPIGAPNAAETTQRSINS